MFKLLKSESKQYLQTFYLSKENQKHCATIDTNQKRRLMEWSCAICSYGVRDFDS